MRQIFLDTETTGLNPEPYAFESAFAVRWLIGRQLDGKEGLNFDAAKGPVRAPWPPHPATRGHGYSW